MSMNLKRIIKRVEIIKDYLCIYTEDTDEITIIMAYSSHAVLVLPVYIKAYSSPHNDMDSPQNVGAFTNDEQVKMNH